MSRKKISKSKVAVVQAESLLQRPQSLGDVVYEALLNKMLAFDIKPEDRISVDDLARKLGVSQTPIREALNRLEAQGLVGRTHLVGYRASPQLTQDQFNHLYETRVQLEPFVAAKAAHKIDPDDLDRLDELLGQLLIAHDKSVGFVVQAAKVDSEFHRVIAAASGNPVAARILEGLQAQVQFDLLRRRVAPMDIRPATLEHRRILSALRKRDAQRAAAAMREHLAASRERYWPQER